MLLTNIPTTELGPCSGGTHGIPVPKNAHPGPGAHTHTEIGADHRRDPNITDLALDRNHFMYLVPNGKL